MQHSALDLDASIRMVMAGLTLRIFGQVMQKLGQMEMETCSQTNQVLYSVMIARAKMAQATSR